MTATLELGIKKSLYYLFGLANANKAGRNGTNISIVMLAGKGSNFR